MACPYALSLTSVLQEVSNDPGWSNCATGDLCTLQPSNAYKAVCAALQVSMDVHQYPERGQYVAVCV